MKGDERELWRIGAISCVMISCCAGAELQVRTSAGAELQVRTSAGAPDGGILLRELYPTKSDLYERARALRDQYGG